MDQIIRTGCGTIVSPGVATTDINALVGGVYQFQLTVTDNSGASSTDIVQVTVNQAPVANAGRISWSTCQSILLRSLAAVLMLMEPLLLMHGPNYQDRHQGQLFLRVPQQQTLMHLWVDSTSSS